jgi:hypothetical protein
MNALILSTLAQIPDPGADVSGFLRLLFDALASKNFGLFAAAVVILLVFATRKWGAHAPGKALQFVRWLATTNRGGVVLSFLWALALGFGGAFASGAAITLNLVLSLVTAALAAIGGFVAVSKFLFPSGADKAQDIEAKAAGVVVVAKAGPEAAADAINSAIKN